MYVPLAVGRQLSVAVVLQFCATDQTPPLCTHHLN
jgi:hypothetical protein